LTNANAINHEVLDDALRVSLSVDIKKFTIKPDKPTTKEISNRIAYYSDKDKLEKLPIIVGERGFTWCPATFTEGKRRIANFNSQQVFGLDFDNGITWEEVQSRASKYRIPIAFAYETFSSINRSKFRVVVCSDIEIADSRTARVIQLALMEIFPECDPSCKDCSRLFFGGKGLIYTNENINTATFNISDLMFGLTEYYRDKDKSNYLRLLTSYAERVGIQLKNGYPRVEIINEIQKSEISGATPIIYNIKGNAPRISNCEDDEENFYYAVYLVDKIKKTKPIKNAEGKNEEVIYETLNTKTGKRSLIRNFDFNKLLENCRLFHEYYNGERWCYHSELWGMATNLCQIKGGGNKFISIISNEANEQYSSYKDKDWGYYINYIQKQDYYPQQCINLCPYSNECNHAKNMILTAKTKRNSIVKLSNHKEYVSLQEAEEDLLNKFKICQSSLDDNIHVIVAQTGIGKSNTYINCLETADKPYIVAVPTNKLKDEIYDKCIDKGYDTMRTPRLPSDLPESINNEIERLYSIGATFTAAQYIRKIAKEKGINQLLEYIDQMELIKTFPGHIITTHSRLLYFQDERFQNHNILIDEDIIKTLLQIEKVCVKDLLKIQTLKYISWFDKNEVDNKFKTILLNSEYQTFIKTEPVSLEDVENFEKQVAEHDAGINSNVIGFLKCTAAYRYNTDKDKMTVKGFYSDSDMIQYLMKHELPGQKVIILSATADEQIYHRMFGDRAKFHFCKEAKYKGKLIQCPQRSYSRECLKTDEQLLQKVKEIAGDIPLITFKTFKEDENDLNFGNTEGHNIYEGQDIAVVGTPHLHEIVYKMYAVALDVDIGDARMKYQEIERNNYRFWFMTYENKELQRIQTWLIESELEQAIGRARLLRNNCSVSLFSNYPLPQAEFKYL
jgi:hypothetical protein